MSARDGACRWHWKTWDEPRPLYFPGHELPAGRTVILVEGEKKADTLQQLLDAGAPGVYCVASWPGGCKAWKKADWSPLAGSTVVAWPDCDAKREPLTPAERKETPDKAAQVVLQQGKPLLPPDKQPGMAAMLGIGALLRDSTGARCSCCRSRSRWRCRTAGTAATRSRRTAGTSSACAFLASAYSLPADAQAPAPAAGGDAAKKSMVPLAPEC
jgi:putative DNA primase/helicase